MFILKSLLIFIVFIYLYSVYVVIDILSEVNTEKLHLGDKIFIVLVGPFIAIYTFVRSRIDPEYRKQLALRLVSAEREASEEEKLQGNWGEDDDEIDGDD